MKRFFFSLLIFCTAGLVSANDMILFLTSKIDENAIPQDRLTVGAFDPAHLYSLVLYSSDRKTPFNSTKVNFNLSKFDSNSLQYFFDVALSMDIKPDWTYCYEGVYFDSPGEYKAVVTNAANDTISNVLYFEIKAY